MDNIMYNVWCGILVTLFVSLLLCLLCYHHIFRPDYRPGHRSMPFMWFQVVKSVYMHSRGNPVLSRIYNSQSMAGLCKLNEKQKIFGISLGGKKYVFLFSPEHAEMIMKSSNFLEKSEDYNHFKDLMKDGLFTSGGEKYKFRRRLLTPTFHFEILKHFAPMIREITKIVVSRIQDSLDKPYINIDNTMKCVGNAILMKTAIGYEIDVEDEQVKKNVDAVHGFLLYYQLRLANPWLKWDFLYNLTENSKKCIALRDGIHDYVRSVIKKKKDILLESLKTKDNNNQSFHKNGKDSIDMSLGNGKSNGYGSPEIANKYEKKHKPFMDLLLEMHFKGVLTEEDVIEEALVFFGAGTFTLGSNLCYILYCIGLYKDVQKRLQKELDEILEGSDREITEKDFQSWNYLDCVIKEGMRLYGVSFFSRVATEDTKIDKYIISRGTIIAVFSYYLHRNPAIWHNPEKFDPSRFLPENVDKRHTFAYMPFSAGIRSCLGQRFAMLEMKTVIAAIIQKFDVHSLDPQDKLYDCSRLPTESDVPVRVRFSLRDKSQK